jgi:hypothetical protein
MCPIKSAHRSKAKRNSRTVGKFHHEEAFSAWARMLYPPRLVQTKNVTWYVYKQKMYPARYKHYYFSFVPGYIQCTLKNGKMCSSPNLKHAYHLMMIIIKLSKKLGCNFNNAHMVALTIWLPVRRIVFIVMPAPEQKNRKKFFMAERTVLLLHIVYNFLPFGLLTSSPH